MSTSAHASIQAAIVAALSGAPALADGRIYANRIRPIGAGMPSAIVVRMGKAEGAEVVLGTLDWATSYSVEVYAMGTTSADTATALDTLLDQTWSRLYAQSSATLGADISITPQIDWQYDEAETPVACAVLTLTARHRTLYATLSPL